MHIFNRYYVSSLSFDHCCSGLFFSSFKNLNLRMYLCPYRVYADDFYQDRLRLAKYSDVIPDICWTSLFWFGPDPWSKLACFLQTMCRVHLAKTNKWYANEFLIHCSYVLSRSWSLTSSPIREYLRWRVIFSFSAGFVTTRISSTMAHRQKITNKVRPCLLLLLNEGSNMMKFLVRLVIWKNDSIFFLDSQTEGAACSKVYLASVHTLLI